MNSILKRLGKVCLGLGVLLVPALGFSQDGPPPLDPQKGSQKGPQMQAGSVNAGFGQYGPPQQGRPAAGFQQGQPGFQQGQQMDSQKPQQVGNKQGQPGLQRGQQAWYMDLSASW